jgi:Uma2 family endonuclease
MVAEHVDTNGAGEVFLSTDVVFDVHEVRRPDLAFFIRSRLHLISEDKAFPVPPDFAVEVLSPSSVQMDRENKFDLYREKGVRFYWIVDPIQRTIEAYELVGRDYVARGRGRGNQSIALPPFPDLSIPLGKLWRPDYSAPRDQ